MMNKNAIIKVQYKRLFEVVKFVATTRRWYRQGKPERCRRKPRLPNNQRRRAVETWLFSFGIALIKDDEFIKISKK